MARSNRCIIFIPGFKGSTLYDENNNFIWPNVLYTQFSHATLNYDLPELDLPNPHTYHSTDIVKSVPIIPHIFNYYVYDHFIKKLTKTVSNKVKVMTFNYDWRDDLSITVENLNTLILNLKSQGINKIDFMS